MEGGNKSRVAGGKECTESHKVSADVKGVGKSRGGGARVGEPTLFLLRYAYNRWLNSVTSGQMTKHGNRVPISLSKSELRKLCTNKTVTIQIPRNTSAKNIY